MSQARAAALISLGEHVRVDLVHERLWRQGSAVELRPKAWQALTYLLRRPGELVTGEAMLQALWPQQDVSGKTLANLLGELRAALGDDAEGAPLLQTVHRRGYRLRAAGTAAAAPRTAPTPPAPAGTTPAAAGPQDAAAAPLLVGRDDELAVLEALRAAAAHGRRQTAFVAGDPGVGKSGLIDHFMARAAAAGSVVCRGGCLEQSTEREPFGPLLALLADLSRGPMAAHTTAALRRCAPSWLAQLPWLVQPQELPGLRSSLAGMGSGRMLREFGALMQALCEGAPLLVVLEDLHWADAATCDLLQLLASDRAPARLLLVASYQPQLAAQQKHPVLELASRLQAQQRAQAATLRPLAQSAVTQYIEQRFSSAVLAAQLQGWALQQSMGMPLYLQAALNHLVDSGRLCAQPGGWQLQAGEGALDAALAEPLRALVAARFARLEPGTRQMLEAASVVGMEFSVPLLAAALDRDALALERECAALARSGQFLRELAPVHWPDGSSGGGYAFEHDIYRRALYDDLAPALRQALHRRVAQRLEAGWAGQLGQVAGQLAAAYAQAALPADTARVLEMSAGVAAQRFAYRATIDTLEACLRHLQQVPQSPERDATEVRVNLLLGNVAFTHHGFSHPRSQQAFEAAAAGAERQGAMRELVRALLGLCVSHCACYEPGSARQLAQRLVALAEARQPSLAAVSHHYAGLATAIAGELNIAVAHHEQALTLKPDPTVPLYFDLHTSAQVHLGRVLGFMGRLPEGLRRVREALQSSRRVSVPADLLQKMYWVGDTLRLWGLNDEARQTFEEVQLRAEEYDQPTHLWAARAGLLALAAPGERDTAALQALLPHHCPPRAHYSQLITGLLLAEAHLAQGRAAQALLHWQACRALVPPGALHEVEVLALHGQILGAGQGSDEDAERSFEAGLAVARQQQCGLHGLQCASAYAGFLQRRGRAAQARALLAEALAAVDGGADDHTPFAAVRQARDALRAGALAHAG